VDPNPSADDPAPNYRVRSTAIHALAEIGDPRALPALKRIAEDQTDPRLQVAASYAICRIAQREP
jgi:HEAT repeat protein